MIKNIFNSRLGINIFKDLIKSIILSLICFSLLYGASSIIAYNSNNQYKANIDNISSSLKSELDIFISENKLPSSDIKYLDNVTNKYQDIELQVIKDDKLIYSSDDLELDDILLNSSHRPYSTLDDDEVEKIFTLKFEDIDTTAIIKDKYDDFIPSLFTFISVLLSIVFFIITFIRLLNKKVDYINNLEKSIHILEGGDLDYKIPIEGNDELSSLALSINNLSDALKERIHGELIAQQSNKELITNVSHDIRTPLTPIIGYLTLLKESEDLSDAQKDKFIDITLSKATQLRKRVDLLFEYSVLYSNNKSLDLHDVSLNDLIDQFIFEGSILLNKNDFKVNLSNNIKDNVGGYIDVDQISRVFDNIFSNIIKYADSSFDVNISVDIISDKVIIKIENHINADCNYSDSTGLGINICKSIMHLHNGGFNVSSNSEIFQTIVSIPLNNSLS